MAALKIEFEKKLCCTYPAKKILDYMHSEDCYDRNEIWKIVAKDDIESSASMQFGKGWEKEWSYTISEPKLIGGKYSKYYKKPHFMVEVVFTKTIEKVLD